jgi:ketosteroid isomerase-like protein
MSAGSTTPDLVELVRRTTEAADRQDLDALMSMCAPDGVYDTTPSGLGTYAGPAAIRAFLKEWWDAFEELHATLEEVLDLGNGVTFSVIRQDARPSGSASSVSTREAHVAEWRAGLAVRVTVYTDLEQGRAAAMRLAEERAGAPDA